MSNSALASLTAQYTDSENEGDDYDSQDSNSSQVIIPPRPQHSTASHPSTPEKLKSSNDTSGASSITRISKRTKRKKAMRRLVSYQDDTVISDEERSVSESSDESGEEEEDEEEGHRMDIKANDSQEGNTENNGTPMDTDCDMNGDGIKECAVSKAEKSGKYSHYNFSLPPEPKGKPPADLVDKIKSLYEKMRHKNMDMNKIIQGRKEFRNPSIYEKLIQFCDINEFGTNYPPEIYDPLRWGPESYYEELSRVQKNEMLKRQRERKDNDKIEQATALARKVEEEAKRRKSKWDQPAAAKTVPPTLTTTVTGTKGTVISAFGSLPKKAPV